MNSLCNNITRKNITCHFFKETPKHQNVKGVWSLNVITTVQTVELMSGQHFGKEVTEGVPQQYDQVGREATLPWGGLTLVVFSVSLWWRKQFVESLCLELLFIWSPTSKQHSRTSPMLLVALKKNQCSPLCWWPVESKEGCQRGKGAVRFPAMWCVNLGRAAASFQAGSETCLHEPWSLAHSLVWLSLMSVPGCLLIPHIILLCFSCCFIRRVSLQLLPQVLRSQTTYLWAISVTWSLKKVDFELRKPGWSQWD